MIYLFCHDNTTTWNVQMVLSHIESLGSNELSRKTAMLLALTLPVDLCQLDVMGKHINLVWSSSQQVWPNSQDSKSLSGPSFVHLFLCTSMPCHTSQGIWGVYSCYKRQETKLFLAVIKSYRAMASSIIATWLKSLLESGGIDISIFQCSFNLRSILYNSCKHGYNNKWYPKGSRLHGVLSQFYYKSTANPKAEVLI